MVLPLSKPAILPAYWPEIDVRTTLACHSVLKLTFFTLSRTTCETSCVQTAAIESGSIMSDQTAGQHAFWDFQGIFIFYMPDGQVAKENSPACQNFYRSA